MHVIGLDIGGANLKVAHSSGAVLSRPFELWRDPTGLHGALRSLLLELPTADLLAVTMTGELCDCYESKRQGVNAILDAVEAVAAGTPIRVWQTTGQFVDVAKARANALQTAAANWLALATFAGRYAPAGPALLLDVGSTTTDIVPLQDGKPVPRGRTDRERLNEQELVYTGVRRTPLCTLYGDGAAELFATTLDVYLLLGRIAEDPNDGRTADGRPATKNAAEARLARMLCADLETTTPEDRRSIAHVVLMRQTHRVHSGIKRVSEKLNPFPEVVILAGEGEFLATVALTDPIPPHKPLPFKRVISLNRELGAAVSKAACAHALTVLASEQQTK
jgi:probable H4MPT-linked C1 transfer pathway protein